MPYISNASQTIRSFRQTEMEGNDPLTSQLESLEAQLFESRDKVSLLTRQLSQQTRETDQLKGRLVDSQER